MNLQSPPANEQIGPHLRAVAVVEPDSSLDVQGIVLVVEEDALSSDDMVVFGEEAEPTELCNDDGW